jgi:dUTP pyrophosphatase
MVNINIIVDNEAFRPEFANVGDAGADIRANLNISPTRVFGESACVRGRTLTIAPNSRVLIDCGFAMAIPKGYEAQIRPRSGKSIKEGAHIPNSVGTIDSGYRGKVMVAIHNMNSIDLHVEHCERIAQMLIKKCEDTSYTIVETLDETERGATGFGDSGKH